MAKKTFEDLAKELGYGNFKKMKENIGNKDSGGLLSFLFGGKKKKETSPTKEGAEEQATGEGGITDKAIPFLDLIAKNSISLPGMARDVNVLRQNIAKLVKLKGEKAATKADKFFKTEEQREAEMEGARAKSAATKEPKGKKEKETKESGGGLGSILDMLNPVKIIGMLFTGIVGAFTSLFGGGSILAILSKIFVPAMLIGGLITGILDGITRWKESGSITETIISALGGFLEFITFGLFGEKQLRQGIDTAIKFFLPFFIDMSEMFDKFVGWLRNNIGIPKIPLSQWTSFTIPSWVPGIGGEKKTLLNDIGPYYPFKSNKTSTENESYTSSTTTALKAAQTKMDTEGGLLYDKDAKKRLEDKPNEEKQKASQAKLGEVVGGTTPTPAKEDPYSPQNAEKDKDSAKGFLSSKAGIIVDPSSSTGYRDLDSNEPVTEEEVRRKVIALGGEPTKILQMAKGVSPAPAPAPAAPAAGGETAGGTISGGGSMSSAGGGTAPTSPVESPAMTAPSGSTLSETSAQVAEGQRLDSAADAGTVVNAPTETNTTGKPVPSSEAVADAYNSSFISNYLTA